jgi:hypothetical protein
LICIFFDIDPFGCEGIIWYILYGFGVYFFYVIGVGYFDGTDFEVNIESVLL